MKSIPRFVVILDSAGARHRAPAVASAAIRGGADVIQVREKELDPHEVATVVRSVIAATGSANRVAVNSFPAIASQLETHLHLPESFAFDRSRSNLARTACVSRSIHGPVIDLDADYAILGNIMETNSKPGKAGLGLDALAQIVRATPLPILAIGGIEPANVGSVLNSGAYGVAVRSYVIESDDPERAARAIRMEIDRWTT